MNSPKEASSHSAKIPFNHFRVTAAGLSAVKDIHMAAFQLVEKDLFSSRKDLAAVRLAYPIDWAMDPFHDRNWCMLLHSFRFAAPAIHEFKHGGDRRFFDWVVQHLREWHAWHATGEAEFSWKDMAMGLRSCAIAWAINRGADLHDMAAAHVERLIDPEKLSMNNHGIFQAHGLMCLGKAVNNTLACTTAIHFMKRLFNQQFLSDGMHIEHSPAYHRFAIQVFSGALESGWYGDLATHMLSHARANEKWLVDPEGRFINIGDSEPSQNGGIIKERDNTEPAHAVVLNGTRYRIRAFPISG